MLSLEQAMVLALDGAYSGFVVYIVTLQLGWPIAVSMIATSPFLAGFLNARQKEKDDRN
jgi:hypothetical protein